MRVSAEHVWPELRNAFCTPSLTAFVKPSVSRSSSSTLADLPPSSRAIFLTVSAPSWATRLPARVEPVNDTMSTSGCEAMASPTVGP